MKLPLIAAAACALALGGCSTVTSLFEGSSIAAAQPSQIADAEKALSIAHLAYQAVGNTLANAAASGLLEGADAAKAQALYDKAGAALDAADKADDAANAPGVLAAVADAQTAIAAIDSLIPKH
ncbi:MAG: hypothetical protein JO261_02510 [Alphaproteobacteria bacterium]|nr:hypothetical protein [Alphaproteobacteria bacterium]MBV9692550.1 hypothetical protein [Alphaproteobacteria bacterium]